MTSSRTHVTSAPTWRGRKGSPVNQDEELQPWGWVAVETYARNMPVIVITRRQRVQSWTRSIIQMLSIHVNQIGASVKGAVEEVGVRRTGCAYLGMARCGQCAGNRGTQSSCCGQRRHTATPGPPRTPQRDRGHQHELSRSGSSRLMAHGHPNPQGKGEGCPSARILWGLCLHSSRIFHLHLLQNL